MDGKVLVCAELITDKRIQNVVMPNSFKKQNLKEKNKQS